MIPKFLTRVADGRQPRQVTAAFQAQCRAKQAAYQQRRALYTSQFRGAEPPAHPATRSARAGKIDDTRQRRLLFGATAPD